MTPPYFSNYNIHQLHDYHSTLLRLKTLSMGAKANLNIGLIGGSFNPPHKGHLHLANVASKILRLQYLLWLITPQNPLKKYTPNTEESLSLSLAKKMTECQTFFSSKLPLSMVSSLEIHHPNYYTITTLQKLILVAPQIQWIWIMGEDLLPQFTKFAQWQRILGMVKIFVVARSNANKYYPSAPTLNCNFALMYRHYLNIVQPCKILKDNLPTLGFSWGRRNFLSSTQLRQQKLKQFGLPLTTGYTK